MILVTPDKAEKYKAQGWWGQQTLWDLFEIQRRERPDAEATVDAFNRTDFTDGAPRRLTWVQLGLEVDTFCRLLIDEGLQRDDVVLVQLPNCVEQHVVYLACARLGIVITPVPVQYREHELSQILRTSGARTVVTCSRIGRGGGAHRAAAFFDGWLREAHPGTRLLAWGADLPAGVRDIGQALAVPLSSADLARVERRAAEAGVTADDVFSLCWTSGTEAAPKAVPRSHNEWLALLPGVIEVAELRPHIRILNPFPMINMAGIATAFCTALRLGATLVQHHPFNLEVFLQQVRDEAIDYTVAPPAVLNMLLQNEQLLSGIDFTRLRRIGSGSAPLSEWMVSTFAERYGVQIVNYFGSNEGASLGGGALDMPDPRQRAQFFPRAGAARRGVQTRLVDLDTERDITEPGQAGELRYDGPTVFSGYFNAPELTAKAFDAQGYYKSGDLFEIAGDQGQFYRYVGRCKDLVIRGGINISSEEIEGLLQACPGVKEVAVIGVPCETLGERVCACVAPVPGHVLTLEVITDYLRTQRIAVYKLPEHLMVLPELPRNPVGKLLKRELRQRFAA
ncbi:MAG: acyl--CoA ligase [Curvibacter lanceolatus]|uniref:class I adenylate-forming enzyme family protein n=1 Tax=Curvibacter lanceolatus TaxID=86182 RepID=UPI002354384C|nr:class I adenylate-forming enzyme family protein [Curvibacter lanceolatus]MBV5291062.1 acyl--CoA ligase [Curvibacter lanceolatus]